MKHKRNKRSRLRGRRTCGWGSRKKHRGSGHRGGVGMAGTGKRADQKKTLIVQKDYFGKHGFSSLRQIKKKKLREINLGDIEKRLDIFGKNTDKGIEVDLEDYKILSGGNLKTKMIINAGAFSKRALDKIKKSGSAVKE